MAADNFSGSFVPISGKYCLGFGIRLFLKAEIPCWLLVCILSFSVSGGSDSSKVERRSLGRSMVSS